MQFEKLEISDALKKVVLELGYTQMTPVQAASIPSLLKGKDIVGQSATGSGKTAAFTIPLLEKIRTEERQTQALVLSPTRELCQQVAREVRRLGRYKKDLRVVILSGGHPLYFDRKALEHGAHIIVATPGRLIDHLGRGTVNLEKVETVVLDEADRMLDMGFREKIEEVLAKTPSTRQTALFSATFPSTIQSISKKFQKDPFRVTVETTDADLPDIEQLFIRAQNPEKTRAVVAILKSRPLESVLVFCNQKVHVDELVADLQEAKFEADRLHGDLEQVQRERVMAKFRNHTTRILVATDVAARGLDVKGLDAVVNYDLPNDPAQYVHRIGRTGRAGATGLSVSFVTDNERPRLERIGGYVSMQFEVRELSTLVKKAPVAAASADAPLAMDTLSIGGGRKDKLRAGDILGALCGDFGLKGPQIGKIEILDRVSFVAVSRKVSSELLKKMQGGKIKGRRFVVNRVQ